MLNRGLQVLRFRMLSAHYRIEIAACYSGHTVGFELSSLIYTAKKIYTETFGTVSIPEHSKVSAK
jgi:hypothetical protein